MFTKKILAAAITSQPSANGVADAIDFDGTNDYLSRSSDLVGNADGKTFTFSAWVWMVSESSTKTIYNSFEGDNGLIVHLLTNDTTYSVTFQAYNSVGTRILLAHTGAIAFTGFTFLHIVGSFDMANTSNRSVYINDVAQSITYTTYTNSTIDFTKSNHAFGAMANGAGDKHKGRLSNLFLDYTYRDLSIEANRRLFITADRKPAAGQAALNPILYLPLNDPTQPGNNLGTGGDFALNGVVARSGRGPSQFNAPYSDLDGSTDYLSRATAPVGTVSSSAFTLAFDFNADTQTDSLLLYAYSANVPTGPRFYVSYDTGNKLLSITGASSSNSMILNVKTQVNSIVVGRNYFVCISVDLSNSANRKFTLNGQDASPTWQIYTSNLIGFSGTTSWTIARRADSAGNYFNGRLGNVFFDTKYIDLSQPANLAKFVTGTGIDAKPADLGANGEKPFGTPPLIYLPMYGNNAGKNYGTGGDFTVNSGPFAGARGPNEFWGNKAVFNESTGRLNRTAQLSGIADSKTLTFAFSVNKAASVLYTLSDTTGATLRATINSSNQLVLLGKNSSGVTILSATVTTAISNATDTSVLVCVDLANAANRAVYLNNVAASVTWATYTNDSIDLTVADFSLGSEVVGANYLNGSLSELYFTTEYIDFSQEANRLKFRDAFGNPVDLRPQIAAGTLPNPAIYMRFDPSNFGKNEGTGGDFVVNGTITDGGQL